MYAFNATHNNQTQVINVHKGMLTSELTDALTFTFGLGDGTILGFKNPQGKKFFYLMFQRHYCYAIISLQLSSIDARGEPFDLAEITQQQQQYSTITTITFTSSPIQLRHDGWVSVCCVTCASSTRVAIL